MAGVVTRCENGKIVRGCENRKSMRVLLHEQSFNVTSPCKPLCR